MFRIDLSQNRLARLVQKRFSDLQLRERDHLQEWLANQPDECRCTRYLLVPPKTAKIFA